MHIRMGQLGIGLFFFFSGPSPGFTSEMEAGGFDKKKLIVINGVQKFKGYALEASEFGGLF